MSAQPALRPNRDVVFRELAGGAVLVNLATDQIYELNETATVIWSQLVQGEPTSRIVDALTEAFDVSAADAVTAVSALLDDLREQGLIE